MITDVDPNELRQRRAVLIAETRSQLEQVKTENRALTAAETRSIDARNTTIDELGKQIEVIEHARELEREEAGVIAVSRPSPAEGGSAWDQATLETGHIRMLRAEERVADVMRATYRGPQLSLGKYLRGIVTGDWAGAQLEQRTMVEGVLSEGGYTAPTPLAAAKR